jgi:hypothetical protein
MNRRDFVTLTGGAVAAAGLGAPGRAEAATVQLPYPSGGDDHATIQYYLNNANRGDILQLQDGTYQVSAKLEMSTSGVTLRGRGAVQTVIDGSGIVSSSPSPVLRVGGGAYGVEIVALALLGACGAADQSCAGEYALEIGTVDGLVVEDCEFWDENDLVSSITGRATIYS